MRQLASAAAINLCFIAVVGCGMGSAPNETDRSALTDVVAINSGGGATGGFVSDTDYSAGGWTYSTAHAIDLSAVSNAAPPSVYQSQRTGGSLTYTVPTLTAGAGYTVRLHFAELYWPGRGTRVFNVAVNGSTVLSNFDVVAAAGAEYKAIAEAFNVNANSSGQIVIALTAVKDNAVINGIEIQSGSAGPVWPNAGWMPYTKGPLLNKVTNPVDVSNSRALISKLFAPGPSDLGQIAMVDPSTDPNPNDFSHPFNFGVATDPRYTIHCVLYACNIEGASVHIPNGARIAGGSDHHLTVRDLASGNEYFLWEVSREPSGGGQLDIGTGGYLPLNSEGFGATEGSPAGYISMNWGMRVQDLEAGVINHALLFGTNCEDNGWVYPSSHNDVGNRGGTPGCLVMGSHLWLDVPPSALPANCPRYAKTVLTALNAYGAYFDIRGGINTVALQMADSSTSYTGIGLPDPWTPFLKSQGASESHGLWKLQINNCGIDFSQHMHILVPPPKS